MEKKTPPPGQGGDPHSRGTRTICIACRYVAKLQLTGDGSRSCNELKERRHLVRVAKYFPKACPSWPVEKTENSGILGKNEGEHSEPVCLHQLTYQVNIFNGTIG